MLEHYKPEGWAVRWFSTLLEFNLCIHKILYWLWPVFLPSTITVTQKLFKILSGYGFWIKCYCDHDIWPKIVYGHLLNTYQVPCLSLRNFSRYWADMMWLTDGRTNERTDGRTDGRPDGRTDERTDRRMDGRTDRRTDGRTPYHNMSDVSLRAFKKENSNFTWVISFQSNAFPTLSEWWMGISFQETLSAFLHE